MTDHENKIEYTNTKEKTVVILLVCLVFLLFLLIFLYKKLNREANGEYTVRRMVYKEGGIRDRVRGAAAALETRLGFQLWPHGHTNNEGEEMQEIHDEEEQVEQGSSRSLSEGNDEEGEEEEGGKKSGSGGDTSDEMPSSEGSEAGEQDRPADKQEAKEGKLVDLEGKGEASGGSGLLVNLKQISGSVTWSEHDGGECKDGDITAL